MPGNWTMFTRKQSLTITAILVVTVVGITSTIPLNDSPQMTYVDGLLDPWSIQDVSDNAQYVIKGTIVDIIVSVDENSEKFGNKPIVFTDAVIAIEEKFAGEYLDNKITIRTVGGKTDEYWTSSAIHPEFKLGETVVVFVGYEPDSEMGDNYFVMGHYLGKYLLEGGKASGPEYKNGLDEKQFLSIIQQITSP